MQLTKREQETLQYIAQGCSNENIAALLGVSKHTAKFHVHNVLLKLDVGTKAEAVWVGVQEGYLVP